MSIGGYSTFGNAETDPYFNTPSHRSYPNGTHEALAPEQPARQQRQEPQAPALKVERAAPAELPLGSVSATFARLGRQAPADLIEIERRMAANDRTLSLKDVARYGHAVTAAEREAAEAAPQGAPQGGPMGQPLAPPTIEALQFRSSTGLGNSIPDYMAKPSDKVVINGAETTVAVALQTGLIRPDPMNGGYRLTSTGTASVAQHQQRELAQAQAQDAEAQAFKQATALAPEAAQFHDQVQRSVPAGIQMKVAAEIGSAAGLSLPTVSELARTMGVSERQAATMALQYSQSIDEQACRAFAYEGIDEATGEAFERWLQGRQTELRRAQTRHVAAGDLGGYRELAREFMSANRHVREQAYVKATVDPGIKSRVVQPMGSNREVRTVTLPGGMEVPMETAVRLGYVKVGAR
ncbi:MAG: hypothetical protein U1E17_05770 [Geminicoccaceae bacterium]